HGGSHAGKTRGENTRGNSPAVAQPPSRLSSSTIQAARIPTPVPQAGQRHVGTVRPSHTEGAKPITIARFTITASTACTSARPNVIDTNTTATITANTPLTNRPGAHGGSSGSTSSSSTPSTWLSSPVAGST